MRQQVATVQACMFVGDNISKGMVNYSKSIPKESIIEVKGKVKVADVTSCTQSDVELEIIELWTVNKSAPILPFQLEDASRKVEN